MPAYVDPQGAFTVTFCRDGRQVERQAARTGERALKMALLMLARLDALQDGDVLKCVEESL